MESRTALVLGVTGGIGSEMAARLLAGGWRVRALHRDPARAGADGRFEWIKGDALVAADVAAAARGTALIVHAVNPPGYRDWDKLVLPMLDNSVSAAEANGALILLPGTVYNYGPDAFPDIAEDAPQNATTRKGRIRVEMERRLRLAAERGRATRPEIKLGICGEHGGDPASIAFCEQIGLDYVSASPYRVPIARLAAAQSALAKKLQSPC